jgi:hypothetical protein
MAGEVEVNLLDSNGRLVRKLMSARMPTGPQRLHSDVKGLAPGAYVVEMLAGGQRSSVRIVR